MRSNAITCADTDQGDLEARYAAGVLSDNEAEAFEQHLFECERCWTMVQRAVEIRAVETRISRGPARRNNRATRWLAIAAAATIVVAGTLTFDAWRRQGSEPIAMRGPTDSLHVVTQTRGTTLTASWERAPEATSYRVRLYSASGTLLHNREVTDTSISLPAASLRATAPGTALYWEIQAINRMRQVVARSGLRAILFPNLGR